MVDRFLRDITGVVRTVLLVGLWSTTWGAMLLAVFTGWKSGLVWLVVSLGLCFAIRTVARRGVTPAPSAPADGASELTLEQRVLARLEAEKAEQSPLADGTAPDSAAEVVATEDTPEQGQLSF